MNRLPTAAITCVNTTAALRLSAWLTVHGWPRLLPRDGATLTIPVTSGVVADAVTRIGQRHGWIGGAP